MCLTCDILNKKTPAEIIYQNEFVIASHCINTSIPGYLILSPKRHITTFGDLTHDEYKTLISVTELLVKSLNEISEIKKVYLLSFGEDTEHFHYHIFPRYDWMLDLEDIYHNGILDGARLFSEAIKKYKSSCSTLNIQIKQIVDHIKQKMPQ